MPTNLRDRGEQTDAAWQQISPPLPKNGRKGKQWSDHRRVVGGILWRLRTGAPWRDVPECYGPWQTCYDRFVRWRRDGTWENLLSYVQAGADFAGELEWTVSVDSTVARAHQHSAGARKRPSIHDAKGGFCHPEDEAIGKSRGGLSTKIHLSCDGKGRPLSISLTAGQRHESTQFETVLDGIQVAKPAGQPGRPRKRPEMVLADLTGSHSSALPQSR